MRLTKLKRHRPDEQLGVVDCAGALRTL